MLTKKSDYRFVNVSDVNITGNVIPRIDVSGPSSDELNAEDFAFLMESVNQRLGTFTEQIPHSLPDGERILELISLKVMAYENKQDDPSPRVLENTPSYTVNSRAVSEDSDVPYGAFKIGTVDRQHSAFDRILEKFDGVTGLKCNDYVFDHVIDRDAPRRIYSDLEKYRKFLCMPFVTSSCDGTMKNTNGSVLANWSGKRFGDSFYYNGSSYHCGVLAHRYNDYYDGVSGYDIEPSSVTLEMHVDSRVKMWIALLVNGRTYNKSDYAVVFAPMTCSGEKSSAEGKRTLWTIDGSYLSASFANSLAGSLFGYTLQKGEYYDIEIFGCNCSSVSDVSDTFFADITDAVTAEVSSIGWKY